MALFPSDADNTGPKGIIALVYLLQALALFLGVTAIVGVVIDYVKRDDVRGSWLATHVRWQIRTFWFTLLWGFIGILTKFFLVGYLVLVLAFVWYIYRFIKGWLYLSDSRALPG